MADDYRSATLAFSSPDATAAFGQDLAPLLAAGDVVLLTGDIGAGKSHLVRAILRRRMQDIGHIEDVPSPTFTLVQTYDLDGTEFWHADLYRLSSPDEAIELGLQDAFETAVCLIEWPEVLSEETPNHAIHLDIALSDQGEDHRRVSIRWPSTLRPDLDDFLETYAKGEHF